MTACTNKGGKAGRVITAALVATLSVGAPVVALATTADAASGDVQLMAATEADAFMAGTVAEYKVGDKVVEGNAAAAVKYADLANSTITISKVDPDAEGAETIEIKDNNATTAYYKKVAKGTQDAVQINGEYYTAVNGWNGIAAGNYIAVALYSGKSIDTDVKVNNVAPAVSFTVTADSLEGAKLMKNVGSAEDPEYTEDITWVSDQKWGDLDVVLDDVVIDAKDENDASNYEIEVYKKGAADASIYDADAVIQPGTYAVVIEGRNAYAGSKASFDLTVGKLDLSKLDLAIADTATAPDWNSINANVAPAEIGDTYWNENYFTVDYFGGKTWAVDGLGEYAATLSVKSDAQIDGVKLSDLVTGTATIKYYRIAEDAAEVTWKYGDIELNDLNNQTITIDPSVKEEGLTFNSIDPTKFSGTYGDDATKLTAGQFSVKLINKADGNEVTDFASLKKGNYELVIEAVPSALEYKVARTTISINVTYRQGTVAEAGTTFTYDGKVVKGTIADLAYDGTDKLDKLGVQVKSGDKTLVEGTDYTVKVTKVVDGKDVEVTEAVDAGAYKVTVSSDTYDISAVDGKETLTFTVGQFDLSTANKVEVEFPTTMVDGVTEYIPYTGEAITPVVKVALTKDADDKDVWTELDTSNYELSFEYKKTEDSKPSSVKEMKEIGFYTITVKGADGSNYKNDADFGAIVSDHKVFVDVENDAWYASAVATAKQQGYVFGVNNSNVFMPEASINRADVVCVIYRMAGGNVYGEDWVAGDYDYSIITKYSDVDGKAYYAEALAWATKVGIVTGYDDGTFGPGNAVTAEEFATMLARYAKIAGTDTSVEDVDAVLGSVADGGQVSEFAREAVAWAVESGYMAQGSDIVPQSEVSRGRMVTIAVRYQPEKADLI